MCLRRKQSILPRSFKKFFGSCGFSTSENLAQHLLKSKTLESCFYTHYNHKHKTKEWVPKRTPENTEQYLYLITTTVTL